jgi:hypothetical protein
LQELDTNWQERFGKMVAERDQARAEVEKQERMIEQLKVVANLTKTRKVRRKAPVASGGEKAPPKQYSRSKAVAKNNGSRKEDYL